MAFSVSNGNASRSGLGRRRFGTGNGTLSEINIVPLVDVVLVLLIIFMLTAHVMEFGLEIKVPEVKQVKDTNEDLPVISITRNANRLVHQGGAQSIHHHKFLADQKAGHVEIMNHHVPEQAA